MWWLSSTSDDQHLRNRWHPLSLVPWLSLPSPVCSDYLLLSRLLTVTFASLMASTYLTYCLIFMCLFVLSALLFVSVCISPSRCQRSCLWFIPSVTLQSKVSQMIRDFMHIASKPLASIVLKRTAWVASCVLTQTIVRVRCVTKFRTWWSMREEQPGVPFLKGTGLTAFQYPFEKSQRRRENNNLLLEQDCINFIAVLKFTDYLTSGVSSTSL